MDYFILALAVLFFVHFFECILYRKLIVQSPRGKLFGFAMTMLIGVVYLRRLKKTYWLKFSE